MGQGVLDGINEPRLAEFTGAHRSTIRRWFRGGVPRWLARLAPLIARGELGELDRTWRGWRIVRGELVSPEGHSFTPGAVRASVLWRARAIELGALDRRARVTIEADPVNRAGVAKLRALELAMQSARRALDDITSTLPAGERNRIFCGEPQSSGSIQRGQRPLIIHARQPATAQGQSAAITTARPKGQELGVRIAASTQPTKPYRHTR